MFWETLSLTQAVTTAMGGGLAVSGLCNLLNGHLSRKQQREFAKDNQAVQKELQLAGFEHQKEMQKEMQEFQAQLQTALQERNFQETERLQKELHHLQFQYSLALQEANFRHQENAWERNHFIQYNWPLISSPQFYVDMVRHFVENNSQIPFQIISTDCLGAAFEKVNCDVSEFFNKNYPISSNTGTLFFNKGWKENMRSLDGNAQIFALHSALAGLPTLIIIPKIAGSHIILNAALWGIGDFMLPELYNIFSIDLNDLKIMTIREELSQIKQDMTTYSLNPQDVLSEVDAYNMQVYEEELQMRQNMENKNVPAERIESYIRNGVAAKYKFRGKEEMLSAAREEFLSTMITLNTSIITDFYFLTEYNLQPKAPVLFQGRKFAPFKKIIAEKYLTLLDPTQYIRESSLNFYLPLYQALTAKSFIEAGDNDTAVKLQNLALTTLDFRYVEKNDIADSDLDAYHCISENNLTAENLPDFIQ